MCLQFYVRISPFALALSMPPISRIQTPAAISTTHVDVRRLGRGMLHIEVAISHG
jgi:hypothetical protein